MDRIIRSQKRSRWYSVIADECELSKLASARQENPMPRLYELLRNASAPDKGENATDLCEQRIQTEFGTGDPN